MRYRELVIVLSASVACAALISHLLVPLAGVATAPPVIEYFGRKTSADPMRAVGSSLTYFAIDWERASEALGRQTQRCGLPGAGPCELEQGFRQASPQGPTVLGISYYDLNEYFVGDYFSEAVPLARALQDLWASEMPWSFAKRVVSQYPLAYARWLFPTAGRSAVVMLAVRTELRKFGLARGGGDPRLLFDPKRLNEARISDFDPGRMARKLADFRAGCQGRFAFNGPKRRALLRLLEQAARQGPLVVLVIPIAPAAQREFIDEDVRLAFEEAIRNAREAVPSASWLRLDELPELQSDTLYWDLVHLNGEGRTRATVHFLSVAGDLLKAK